MYTLLYNTGRYYEECEKCTDKEVAYKTWDNFQTFFQNSQRKMKRGQLVTAMQGNYQGLKAVATTKMENVKKSLVNMASSAASDLDTIASQ